MSNAAKFGKVAVFVWWEFRNVLCHWDSGQVVLEALLRSGCKAEAFDPQERRRNWLVGYDRAFYRIAWSWW